jgi:hypothetical protein
MKKNMGGADKLIRLVVAAIIAILFFFDIISGTLGLVLLIAAAVFAVTSLISFCPLYSVLGFNTCHTKEK